MKKILFEAFWITGVSSLLTGLMLLFKGDIAHFAMWLHLSVLLGCASFLIWADINDKFSPKKEEVK